MSFERRICAQAQHLQIFKKFNMSQMNPKEVFHSILSSTTLHCRSLPLMKYHVLLLVIMSCFFISGPLYLLFFVSVSLFDVLSCPALYYVLSYPAFLCLVVSCSLWCPIISCSLSFPALYDVLSCPALGFTVSVVSTYLKTKQKVINIILWNDRAVLNFFSFSHFPLRKNWTCVMFNKCNS